MEFDGATMMAWVAKRRIAQDGGSHHPAQFFFLRPTPSWSRHRTPIRGLFICGSGTWPGGGVGGGSGAMVADAVLKG